MLTLWCLALFLDLSPLTFDLLKNNYASENGH
jgi:hypothetical protein